MTTHYLLCAVLPFVAGTGTLLVLYVLHTAGRPCATCGRPAMDCDGHGPHEVRDTPHDPDFAATVRAGHVESPDAWAARTGTNPTAARTEGTTS